MKFDSTMTVSELMARHPSTIHVFIEQKMLCIGCPAQDYHTLREVAQIHGYDEQLFLKIMRQAMWIEEEQ